jgi:sterol desaturase/sphingolipid hydroxylase (fatty acid hydroxylase superfamily)
MFNSYQDAIYSAVTVVVTFLAWTFTLYWIHRFIHRFPILNNYHQDHHLYIDRHRGTKWHWNNIFLYNDTWKSTVDLWTSEVIPTIIFSAVTGCWWLFIFYYLWAAFLQESLEHNPNFDRYPLITSGKWHLLHHKKQRKNYGLFIPLWDKIFKTELLVK